MRVLTYNVHSCRGTDGVVAPERIARVIAATGADVVCLQELDAHRPRSGRIHQAEVLARTLEMDFHFHPALRLAAEEYGDAILSRYPLRLIRSGPLPQPSRLHEPRGALWVELDVDGTRWQLLNTHLGLAPGERRQQALALSAWLEAAGEQPPVLLCGDLNSLPGSRVHRVLGSSLREAQRAIRPARPRPTFSTRFPWICLDYVYASRDVEVVSAEVVDTALARVASDHFPLLAEVRHAPVQSRQTHAAAGSDAMQPHA